ncbi:MAG: alkaline phosphatase PhoX [bacterium]|nr:alkaline phosphatase PhoX [bacterium]
MPASRLVPVALGFAALAIAQVSQASSLPDLLSDLAPGLSARVLIRAGEKLSDGTTFAPHNDLTAVFPGATSTTVMVGHELKLGRDGWGGHFTRLELADGKVVSGRKWVGGMQNNCAGTVTPWGTILSGEEYPEAFYPGDRWQQQKAFLTERIGPDHPGASVGWIYEIGVKGLTGAGQQFRRTGLGHFSHESAVVMPDERTVYVTEDFAEAFLYRFVADRPRDLSSGKLSALDATHHRWVPVQDPLNAHIEARDGGATVLRRLEDIQIAPDGSLAIAETGYVTKGPKDHLQGVNDPFGRVLKLDPRTCVLSSLVQGDGKRLANPDNLLFDAQGRLLICEDQFDANLETHGRNEVLRLEKDGSLMRIAEIAGGEPTGPSWLPGGKTLILSIMHEDEGGVVAIEGF